MSWFSVLLFSLTAAVLFVAVGLRLAETRAIDVQSSVALIAAAAFALIAVTDMVASLRVRSHGRR